MYALILYDEMKIDRFVDVSKDIPNVYFIDMSNHPQKDVVKEGWYYNPSDNSFSEKCPENLLEKLTQPTLEEQLSEVQDNQLVMMDAIATSYEKEAELSDNQLMIMDAIATLFEMQTQ